MKLDLTPDELLSTTRAVRKRIPAFGVPRHIVITADGATAVVANEAGYVQFIR